MNNFILLFLFRILETEETLTMCPNREKASPTPLHDTRAEIQMCKFLDETVFAVAVKYVVVIIATAERTLEVHFYYSQTAIPQNFTEPYIA